MVSRPERVEAHLLLERAERGDAERLGLPAREQRRAVRARRDAHFDRDVADLVLGATVGALLVHGDALADDRLLELLERELHGGTALLGARELLLGGALRRRRGVLLEDRRLDRRGGVLALELVLDLGGRVERRAVGGADRLEKLGVDRDRLEDFLLLADLLGELALQRAQLLDRCVRDVERVEDLGLGNLVGAGLDHQDGLLGAGHDQVEFGCALESPSAVGGAGPPRWG